MPEPPDPVGTPVQPDREPGAAAPAERRAEDLLVGALADRAAWLRVRGGCMRPLLVDGDRIRVEAIGGDLEIGALYLVRTARGELACHRLLRSAEDGFLVAGDRGAPEVLGREALLGRITAAERGGRRTRIRWSGFDRCWARWHPGLGARRSAVRLGAAVRRVAGLLQRLEMLVGESAGT